MKRTDRKSHCPVNFALETFGDPWTLLIVRDIAFFGRKTYGEFLESPEHISTNILANRLTRMEREGLLVKTPHPTDRRKEVYNLTEKGIRILPATFELCGWSTQHDPETTSPREFVALAYANREVVFKLVHDTVLRGGAVFVGEDSVVAQLRQMQLTPPSPDILRCVGLSPRQ